jgi:aspartate/methionine/tyrosine aminotransferase
VAHSFSKSFLMTGWRLGWLVMPPAMTHHMGKLIEFNTSCASVFTQRAALAAITPHRRGHAAGGGAPEGLPRHAGAAAAGAAGVEVARPSGGMYAFFKLSGFDDSLALAKRLVAEAGPGHGAGQCVRARGAGLAALVLRVEGPGRLGRAWTGWRLAGAAAPRRAGRGARLSCYNPAVLHSAERT